MADDDQELDDVLRAELRALAVNKGPCPPVERILQYQAHELPQEAEREVHAHLLVCGLCEAFLLRVERFAAKVTEPQSPRGPFLRFFGRPLVAYSLAGILLAALLIVGGRKPSAHPLPNPPVMAEALPAFDLPQTRGNDDLVVRPGGSETFILRFFVPMRADDHYMATISDGADREVIKPLELKRADSHGMVDLLCRSQAFAAGSYVLTVLEKSSARQFQYYFQVQ